MNHKKTLAIDTIKAIDLSNIRSKNKDALKVTKYIEGVYQSEAEALNVLQQQNLSKRQYILYKKNDKLNVVFRLEHSSFKAPVPSDGKIKMHGSGYLSSKITILQFDMTQINSEQPNIPCLSSNFTQAQRLLNEIFPDYTEPVQALLKSKISEKEGCSTFAQVLDEMMQKFGKAILKELHMPNGASLVTPKSDELDQPVVRVILENFALSTMLNKETLTNLSTAKF